MRLMDEVIENRLLSAWADLLPRAPNQLGAIHQSDCELVPLGRDRLLALTVDTIAEELRCGLYRSAVTGGRVAACAALSDLAAVGADPTGILLSVSLPAANAATTQAEVATGVRQVCVAAGVSVLGGDTNEGPNLEITCVGVGTVPPPRPLTRVGARAGDFIFASGPLGIGGALAASRLLDLPGPRYAETNYRPQVRLAEGRSLRALASACMDTSDGLLATLDQLARINDLGLRITRPLPQLLEPQVESWRRAVSLPAFPLLACHHGEYELVFTVPESRLDALRCVARGLGWEPVLVGHAEPGKGLFVRDVEVDGAFIRNLPAQTGGDSAATLDTLLALGVSD